MYKHAHTEHPTWDVNVKIPPRKILFTIQKVPMKIAVGYAFSFEKFPRFSKSHAKLNSHFSLNAEDSRDIFQLKQPNNRIIKFSLQSLGKGRITMKSERGEGSETKGKRRLLASSLTLGNRQLLR